MLIFRKWAAGLFPLEKEYDTKSIMHELIPNELTIGDFEVGPSKVLSEGDKAWVTRLTDEVAVLMYFYLTGLLKVGARTLLGYVQVLTSQVRRPPRGRTAGNVSIARFGPWRIERGGPLIIVRLKPVLAILAPVTVHVEANPGFLGTTQFETVAVEIEHDRAQRTECVVLE